MTQAITVRRDGDTFQARQFWWYASQLLRPDSGVIRVGFEAGPKSFDDLWVEYDPKRAPKDAHGRPVFREHLQCKWHGTHDSYGYTHLADPAFIHAESTSLLQRALAAQRSHAPAGEGIRFKLVSNWSPAKGDPLQMLINTRSESLRLQHLYGTKTARSAMGEVRRFWSEHLGITEEELWILAGTLGFSVFTLSPERMREWLNERFENVGLLTVPVHQSAFSYDDVVFQWMAQGRQDFTAMPFRELCEHENLLGPVCRVAPVFGVKSFEHMIDRLEDRCIEVLNLVPNFHDRFIQSDADWATRLYPELVTFLRGAAGNHQSLRLVLDAHTTLAFAAGAILNIKAGRAVELEQRAPDRQLWSANDVPLDPDWSALVCNEEILDSNKPDLAVVVSLTHYAVSDVRAYLMASLPSVGRVLAFSPSTGFGRSSVRSGSHAAALADTLCSEVRKYRRLDTKATTHLFIAAPNAFTFFAGQRQSLMGRVVLYEFDLEGDKDSTYRPSLTLPILESVTLAHS